MIDTCEMFSMTGSAAALCTAQAMYLTTGEKLPRKGKLLRQASIVKADAVPDGTCGRCGVVGIHRAPSACIDALRSEIARMEFQLDVPPAATAKKKPQRPAVRLYAAPPARRGG